MRQYEQVVLETRVYQVRYIVEAGSIEEAQNKIAIGDTVEETEIRCDGVLSREPWDDIEERERSK